MARWEVLRINYLLEMLTDKEVISCSKLFYISKAILLFS